MSESTPTPNAPGELPQLPFEIIRHIIRLSLPPFRTHPTREPRYSILLPLLLVNSTWSTIAHELLYQAVTLEEKTQFDRFCSSERAREAKSVVLGLTSPHVGLAWDKYRRLYKKERGWSLELLADVSPEIRELLVCGRVGSLEPLPPSLIEFHEIEGGPKSFGTSLPHLRRYTSISSHNNDFRDLFLAPAVFPVLRELVLVNYHESHPLYTELSPPILPTQIHSLALLIAPPDTLAGFAPGASHTKLLTLFTSLKHLILGGNEDITPDHFPACIASLATHSLESLSLEADFAQDNDILRALKDSPHLKSLLTLRLSYSIRDRDGSEKAGAPSSIRDLCAKRGVALEERYLSYKELDDRSRWDWYTQEFRLI